MCTPIKSPVERRHVVTNGKTLADGRRLAERGQRWMERNRDAYRELLAFARAMQAQGRAGCCRDLFKHHCFKRGIKVSSTQGLTFDNSLWAVVARYMALEDESLIGAPLTFRESAVDVFGLLPVSWMEEGRK